MRKLSLNLCTSRLVVTQPMARPPGAPWCCARGDHGGGVLDCVGTHTQAVQGETNTPRASLRSLRPSYRPVLSLSKGAGTSSLAGSSEGRTPRLATPASGWSVKPCTCTTKMPLAAGFHAWARREKRRLRVRKPSAARRAGLGSGSSTRRGRPARQLVTQ